MKELKSVSVARSKADAETTDPQERNRIWWETLPMTYQDWESDDRRLVAGEHYRDYIAEYRNCSSYVQAFPFDGFRGKKVLEIGCGFGAAACLFAQGGATITAVDLTAAAIEGTKAIARFIGLEIDARQMDAERLAFDDASFDYVFSWGVCITPTTAKRHFGRSAGC